MEYIQVAKWDMIKCPEDQVSLLACSDFCNFEFCENREPQISITQRLRTDLGRSVGVTTPTQLVWLISLRVKLSHSRNNRVTKRTNI